jgi:soluble lytic murein transglycosylase-like protein
MRYKTTIDTLLQIGEHLTTPNNPLRFHKNLIAPLMEKFEELFLLRELLGDDMAMLELARNKYYPETLKGWISIAEVYKRLGAYNEAFRIYDYINNKYYSDLPNLEKPFLLKESYPLYYDSIVGDYGQKRDLDKNLVLALIRAESGFNPRAHSWADAYGLMQIVPRTARSLAAKLAMPFNDPTELFNPDLNIDLGTLYLYDLLRQFDGIFEHAVAAYNAGPHRVSRWKEFLNSDDIDFFVENIEYTQTRNYTRRVMKNYWIYTMLDEII